MSAVGHAGTMFADELVNMAIDHASSTANLSYKVKAAMDMGRAQAIEKYAKMGLMDDLGRLIGRGAKKGKGRGSKSVASGADEAGQGVSRKTSDSFAPVHDPQYSNLPKDPFRPLDPSEAISPQQAAANQKIIENLRSDAKLIEAGRSGGTPVGRSSVGTANQGTIAPGTVAAQPKAMASSSSIGTANTMAPGAVAKQPPSMATANTMAPGTVAPPTRQPQALANTLPPGSATPATPATASMKPMPQTAVVSPMPRTVAVKPQSNVGAAAPPTTAPTGAAPPAPSPTTSPVGAPAPQQQLGRLGMGLAGTGIGVGGVGLGAAGLAASRQGVPQPRLPTPQMPNMIGKTGSARLSKVGGVSLVKRVVGLGRKAGSGARNVAEDVVSTGGLGTVGRMAFGAGKAAFKAAPKTTAAIGAVGLGGVGLAGYGAYRAGKSQLGVHQRMQRGAYRHGGYTAKPWMRSYQM